MHQVLFLIQIVLAGLLILSIIVQQKGTGLGSTFGGEMGFYRTKRGAEKLIFYATIILVVLFISSSILGLII
jgi:protein translocase SecG subunit